MAIEFEKFKLPQKYFEDDYLKMIRSLLPKGFLWVFERVSFSGIIQDVISHTNEWFDTVDAVREIQDTRSGGIAEGNLLTRLLQCFANELSRIEADAWRLLNETDPGVAVDLLEDWERVLGLPESCFVDRELTIDERQRQAHVKLFQAAQTATRQFYIDYAASLGFTITVETEDLSTAPRRMGVARMGFERMGGSSGDSIFQITIHPGGASDNDFLKCSLNKVKPAHTIITYIEL